MLTSVQIRDQLNKIEESELLRDSTMIKRFLNYVVNQTIDNPDNPLKQYTIAVEALGRPESFDPTFDPIVRIQAGRLRRCLEQYYQRYGEHDSVIISLPVGQYTPVFTAKQDRVAVAVTSSSITQEETMYTIAVEPLNDFRQLERNDFLAEGFSQELLAELALYKHLQIVRVGTDPTEAAKKKVARFLVTGSLYASGQTHRLSINLADNQTNQILWTTKQKFNYPAGDIISVQENIATWVAQEIAGLNGIVCERLYAESNWTSSFSPVAYATYMHFYKYNKNPTEQNASDLLGRVSELLVNEPNFAPGYAVLTNLYTDAYMFGLDKKNLELALEFGEKAVELQANNQICPAYYGYALMVGNKLNEAKMHFDKALALNPNSLYFTGSIGWAFCLMGFYDRGFELLKASMKNDLQYPKWFHLATFVYYTKLGDFNQALTEAISLEKPDLYWSPLIRLIAYANLGMEAEAMKQAIILQKLKPDFFDHPAEYISCLIKDVQLRNEMTQIVKNMEGNVLKKTA
jgi:TolB-like protein